MKMPYLNIGCFPYVVRFCDSQAQWNREIKKLSADEESWTRRWVNPGARATAWYCTDAEGYVSFIVAFDRAKLKGTRGSVQAGCAAHEAVHVVDWIIERINESKALGSEWHAYQVQEITEWLLRHLWAVKK